jgi:3-phosphoshikimate 1-carboxyvinyltransferase
MKKEVHPATGPVSATIRLPGSKSITNRALICAALAQGESILRNTSDSDDTALLVNGLNQLGVLVRKQDRDLRVEGKGGRVYAPRFPIPVGNAGTTLRFLMGISALADGKVMFEGGGRMSERPMLPMIEGLRELGVYCEAVEFAARYAVRGGSLRGGSAHIRADVSSQFLSSLLMVAPYATADVRLYPSGTGVSTPYVNMTTEVMRRFGCEVRNESDGSLLVSSGQRYSTAELAVEPDFSAASVFCAAAAITGGEVWFDYGSPVSLQGDFRVFGLLAASAGSAESKDGRLRFSSNGAGSYDGFEADLRDMPDVVPPLVSMLLFARSPGRIHGVRHLRFKESDRLETLSTELRKIGARVRLTDDGLEIVPGPLTGGVLDPHDDHRLAMSFAIIGLRVPGVCISNPECVRKSFPSFWTELERLVEPE